MKAFKLFALLAVLLGLATAVFAAASAEESDIALLEDSEIDAELTEQFNAQAFDADESEVALDDETGTSIERRGAWYHKKYPPMPPKPTSPCCYLKGYAYAVGTWYGNCYCDKSGQWVCVKPKPPAPLCCVWNGKNYYEGEYVWFNKGYYCYCSGGQWTKCNYVKPQPAPMPHKPWYHKKW